MISDPINDLPTREEVGVAIAETARRARRLRSLYRLLVHVDNDRETINSLTMDLMVAPVCGLAPSDTEGSAND